MWWFKIVLLLLILSAVGIGQATEKLLLPIHGKIVDSRTSAPIYKARLHLGGTDIGMETNENGNFNCFLSQPIPHAGVTLFISRNGYESTAIVLPLNEIKNSRKIIRLMRAFYVPEVLSAPGFTLSGKIVNADGRGLEKVGIYVTGASAYSYSRQDGRFSLKVNQPRLPSLPSIWVVKPGYRTQAFSVTEVQQKQKLQLISTPTSSRVVTLTFQDEAANLQEEVLVFLNGVLRDSTGVLGSVTCAFADGYRQSFRISYWFPNSAPSNFSLNSGSLHFDPHLLPRSSEVVIQLSAAARNQGTISFTEPKGSSEAPIFRAALAPQDSILLTQILRPIPPVSKVTSLEREKSSATQPEAAMAVFEKKKPRPHPKIINLVPIDISVPETLSIPPEYQTFYTTRLNGLRNSYRQPNDTTAWQKDFRSGTTIQSVIQQHQHAITDCYKQALKKNKDLKGMIEVRFVVIPSGRIIEPEIIYSSLSEITVEQCLVARMQRWRSFPPIDSSLGNWSYRIRYRFGE